MGVRRDHTVDLAEPAGDDVGEFVVLAHLHHGDEVDLQRLVTSFPWIVEPDLAVLTANQQLKTAIAKAEELGQIATGRRSKGSG